MSTPPSKEGGGGSLALPADCEGLISEKAWALLGEERRRMVMDTLHRTEADNVETPRGRFDEFHFSPVSPGLGFTAMMPSDGYWEAVRRQREEDARRQKEEDDLHEKREQLARQQREELVRQQTEERARQKSEVMLLQASQSTTPAISDSQGESVTMDMDLSSKANGSHLLSRDVHDAEGLLFLRNYRIDHLSETKLGPMRYTSCELEGERCHHYPSTMLQIYDIVVNFNMGGPYFKVMRNDILDSPIEVYGFFATRDVQDYSRNYIFHRTRENAQALNVDGGYLRLRNPARGISATSCLIEIDIRIKAKHVKSDTVIIDGSVVAVGDFDPWRVHHVDWLDGRVTFESSVVERGVEATIQLDFLEVPQGGFHVQMRGNTAQSKRFYYLIDECRRDSDGFIASPGKYDQKFIVAVRYPDILHIEFMEERDTLSFVATKHGNEQQLYRFNNGALVSVQVYWSTIGDVYDSDTE